MEEVTSVISSATGPGVIQVTGAKSEWEPWSTADRAALNQSISLIHGRLRFLARHKLWQEANREVFQTDELVSELYMRLCAQKPVQILNQGHFLGICARLLWQILTDEARRRLALSNGGGVIFLSLHDTLPMDGPDRTDILALHRALERLGRLDEEKRRVAELRFLFGLTIEETAVELGVSNAKVKRHWDFAQAWLLVELG